MSEVEYRPRKRAARLVYLMMLRELAGAEGFTTVQVADVLGMTRQGAYDLLVDISGAEGVPIWGPDKECRWGINIDELRIADRFKNK